MVNVLIYKIFVKLINTSKFSENMIYLLQGI